MQRYIIKCNLGSIPPRVSGCASRHSKHAYNRYVNFHDCVCFRGKGSIDFIKFSKGFIDFFPKGQTHFYKQQSDEYWKRCMIW